MQEVYHKNVIWQIFFLRDIFLKMTLFPRQKTKNEFTYLYRLGREVGELNMIRNDNVY